MADALVACFTDSFRGLADLKKTTLRTNAAAAAAAAAAGGDPGSALSSVSLLLIGIRFCLYESFCLLCEPHSVQQEVVW